MIMGVVSMHKLRMDRCRARGMPYAVQKVIDGVYSQICEKKLSPNAVLEKHRYPVSYTVALNALGQFENVTMLGTTLTHPPRGQEAHNRWALVLSTHPLTKPATRLNLVAATKTDRQKIRCMMLDFFKELGLNFTASVNDVWRFHGCGVYACLHLQ